MVQVFGVQIFRYEQAFGQEIVTGLSWEVLTVFVFLAFFTFLVHFVVRDLLNPADHTPGESEPDTREVESNLRKQGIDEVERFTAAQRASHWIMAISIFLLMLSGFVMMNPNIALRPIAGISWVDIHIVFSLVLIGYVVFHLGHVASKGNWREMWVGRREFEDLWLRFQNLIGRTERYPKQFKYPSAQKLLHLGVTAATFGVLLTGFVLLRRVDVPVLWSSTREFTFLGIHFGLGLDQGGLGLVEWSFVLHDLFAIGMVGLVLGHVYFALRPEEWGVTRSMITGTVPVETYAEKYSPRSWSVGGVEAADGGEKTADGEAADGVDTAGDPNSE